MLYSLGVINLNSADMSSQCEKPILLISRGIPYAKRKCWKFDPPDVIITGEKTHVLIWKQWPLNDIKSRKSVDCGLRAFCLAIIRIFRSWYVSWWYIVRQTTLLNCVCVSVCACIYSWYGKQLLRKYHWFITYHWDDTSAELRLRYWRFPMKRILEKGYFCGGQYFFSQCK
jgi:hypothetical protein